MTTLRLILGDQLNPLHDWYAEPCEGVVYVLMEVRQETDYVLHHAQKILGIFAAMRDFTRHLRELGHEVVHLEIDDPANLHALPANLDRLIAEGAADRFEWQEPDEWRLDQQLRVWAAGVSIETLCVSTQHFYTERDEAEGIFAGRKQWLMEHFYRRMRTRHQVLLTGVDQPEGGQWNFDHDNRKPWSGLPREPSDWRGQHDHSALWTQIVDAGVQSFGNPAADRFRWPLNRAEALENLHAFVDEALPHFGDFQDALTSRAWRLFHSLLSFALNVKMLSPREVVNAAEAAYRDGRVPLPAAEGFVRQILGWREYVRGVYWAAMPDYVESNFFEHRQPLPSWFWTGETKMRCVSHAITQSLEEAYAHHIQRLMVIGNFALLAGLDPQALHRWYLGIYVDAFEWVELPNVLGMSQFADGGRLATKPYVSSAAYVDRMSDYCKGCRYDRKARTGEDACPFNALYWDFFARNAALLERNPRIGMAYRQLAKMEPDTVKALREQAQRTLANLESL